MYKFAYGYCNAKREFTNEPIQGGTQYSFSDLNSGTDPNADTWESIPNCQGGDYGGCSVTRANYEIFKEEYADHNDVAFLFGGYGSYDVIYRVNTEDTQLKDLIAGLDNYPSLDDDKVTEIEMEWSNEAWESWAESDYRRTLIKAFTGDLDINDNEEAIDKIEMEIENIDSDRLREIFEEAADCANEYWESQNCDMYIDVKKVADRTTAHDLGIEHLIPTTA